MIEQPTEPKLIYYLLGIGLGVVFFLTIAYFVIFAVRLDCIILNFNRRFEMKSLTIIVLLVLVMLVTPALVHGRLDEISPAEWAELKREDRKDPPVETQAAPPIGESYMAEVGEELDPDDYYCIGRHIQEKIFWVPDWCLERALPQVPTEMGQLLFCKLGYYGAADEYAIAPALPGEDKVAGWSLCADL